MVRNLSAVTAPRSAGLLVFRRAPVGIELLLGHLGGPLWARRDAGAWSVPKGLVEAGEADEAAARREFSEELGLPAPAGPWLDLGEARQSSGKVVTLWAVEGDLDPATAVPGTFEMEWPRGSGRVQQFPEIDRVRWFDPATAVTQLVTGQRIFVDRLVALVTA